MTALDVDALAAWANWRGECHEDVTRQGQSQPCEKVAVALRLDPSEGVPYPVCAYHARSDMVPLSALVAGVERLTVVRDAIREDRDMLGAQRDEARAENEALEVSLSALEGRYERLSLICDSITAQRDALTARIEAALVLCDEYNRNTRDEIRAALSPQEGT